MDRDRGSVGEMKRDRWIQEKRWIGKWGRRIYCRHRNRGIPEGPVDRGRRTGGYGQRDRWKGRGTSG